VSCSPPLSRFLLSVSVAALLSSIAGCRGAPKPQIERLAVLGFENLSGDSDLDWLGPALREGVVQQLTGLPDLNAGMFDNPRDAVLGRATLLLTGYYSLAGGRIRLEAEQRRLTAGKGITRRRFEADQGDRLLRMQAEISTWVNSAAGPVETRHIEALRALAEGRLAANASLALGRFKQGAEADPDYGPLYIVWAQALLNLQDRSGALAVLEQAERHRSAFRELRQRELAVLQARLQGDRGALLPALRQLSESRPADPVVLIELAREETAAAQYAEAEERLRQAVRLDPGEPAAWNDLGYAEARLKRLDQARAALAEYQKLAPMEANPLDSLGDVHYHLGEFDAAAKYYSQAFEKNSAFLGGVALYKAARARLMNGDVQAARDLFARYAELRRKAGDPLADAVEADGLRLTGDGETAVRKLRTLAASSQGAVAQLASARLATWELAAGGSAEGVRLARAVLQRAQSPFVRATASFVLAVSGVLPQEQGPAGPFQSLSTACRMLLGGRYAEAAGILRPIVKSTDPLSQEQVGVLLAWALVESGELDQAATLLDTYGTPPAGMEPPLSSFTFPRIFLLKAKVLQHQGKSNEASRAGELHRLLSFSAR